MASVEIPKAADQDWVLGNPWWWMGLGLFCCGLAWLWMAALGQSLPAGRFTLLTLGLLMAAASVIIRLKFTQPVFLGEFSGRGRRLILTGLTVLLGGLAVTVSVLLVLAFMRPDSVEWRWGPLLVCWVVVAPMAELAAVQSLRRLRQGEPLTQREEGAALLLLAALASYAATRALFDPHDVLYMDSMRLFLSVLTLTALAAAPLALVPQDVRRKVISLLILLHFTGILCATLVVTNPPKALKQLADRIFRPYLQFFYLSNAYHFYAPEPGPASYMWFRILFVDKEGREVGQWLKVPEIGDDGQHPYSTSLTYVRLMCIIDHATPLEPAASFFDVYNRPLKFYEDRLLRIPGMVLTSQAKSAGLSAREAVQTRDDKAPAEAVHSRTEPAKSDEARNEAGLAGEVKKHLAGEPSSFACKSSKGETGKMKPGESRLLIPWHPLFTYDMQYRRPGGEAQSLLRSFARHVLAHAELTDDGKLAIPTEPSESTDYKVKSVKIYHVTHQFLSPDVYRLGVDEPADPHTYRAMYLGEFGADGNLLETQDAFLYWMLPAIREKPERDTLYRCYIRRHAGDPAWVRDARGRWGPDPDEK